MNKSDLLFKFHCCVAQTWLFFGRISLAIGNWLTGISGKCNDLARAAVEKAKQYLYA